MKIKEAKQTNKQGCNLKTVAATPKPHDREVYDRISPGFKGRCTAPLLIDAGGAKVAAVSNESAGIVRQLGELCAAGTLPGSSGVQLRPPGLEAVIDALNDEVWRAPLGEHTHFPCAVSLRPLPVMLCTACHAALAVDI